MSLGGTCFWLSGPELLRQPTAVSLGLGSKVQRSYLVLASGQLVRVMPCFSLRSEVQRSGCRGFSCACYVIEDEE